LALFVEQALFTVLGLMTSDFFWVVSGFFWVVMRYAPESSGCHKNKRGHFTSLDVASLPSAEIVLEGAYPQFYPANGGLPDVDRMG
jgi:hypothetical protein